MKIFALLGLVATAVILTVWSAESGRFKKPESQLLEIDRKFCLDSIKMGRNQAFLKYCAEDAVILAKEHFPIEGKERIREYLEKKSDESYMLTWEPRYARIAASGELGYTYGLYRVKSREADPRLISSGSYVTIWKKNHAGQWRFALDTGSEGLPSH